MEDNKEVKKLNKGDIENYFDKVAGIHKNMNSVLDISNTEQAKHSNIYRDYFTKKYIRKNVSPRSTDTILDFGCGVGRVTGLMAASAKKVVGADLSSQMIKVADESNKNSNVNFIHIKSTPFPLEENSFDKIFTNWVMQHVSENDIVDYFNEFHRLLKKGGMVYIFEQTKETAPEKYNPNHIYRKVEDYIRLFKSSSLKYVRYRHVMRVPARGMSLWNKHITTSSAWKYLLSEIDDYTIARKPQFADYYTTLFIGEK